MRDIDNPVVTKEEIELIPEENNGRQFKMLKHWASGLMVAWKGLEGLGSGRERVYRAQIVHDWTGKRYFVV